MHRTLIALAVIVLTASCAGTGELTASKLDLVTGVTVTYDRDPLVFYRDNFGKAAHARNILYVGPIEVNRSGTYRYYLWLGIWDTGNDPNNERTRDGFESITIFADGEPLSFDVSGWTADAIGASASVYTKPVASAVDAYYEITVDHLRLLAEAKDIRVQSSGSKPVVYEPWDNQVSAKAGLREFLRNSVY
jgi:hypothetical protein